MLPIRHILCPIDFSPHSANAFNAALGLAQVHGARLTVVHVMFPPPALVAADIPVPYPADSEKAHWRHVEDQLKEFSSNHSGVAIERKLEQGDAAAEILTLAENTAAGLIVMGTQGRRGLTRLLLGSVAEAVARKAPMPVLLVKATPEKTRVAEPIIVEEKTPEPAPAVP